MNDFCLLATGNAKPSEIDMLWVKSFFLLWKIRMANLGIINKWIIFHYCSGIKQTN
jgi:hypothetical protein